MSNKEEVVRKLKSLKPQIQTRYKARAIGLFGSFIHGEQNQASDIDLLVDFEEGADLFHLSGLAEFLEQQLQRKVDLVSRRGLRQELRERILREVAMV
jgi:hypothetical protein